MTPTLVTVFLFGFVLLATTLAGYLLVVRPLSLRAASLRDASLRVDSLRDDSLTESFSGGHVLTGTLRTIGETLPDPPRRGDLKRRLSTGGYRAQSHVSVFNGLTYATAVVFALIGSSMVLLRGGSVGEALLASICTAVAGYLLPRLVLSRLAGNRAKQLKAGLPAALDLLVLMLEAGQPLDQSLLDVSRELQSPFPHLAGEFAALHTALRTNTSRHAAFEDFGDRNGAPELRKVAVLLADSDRLGAGLAHSLRILATSLRTRRRQAAQEAARKVGVKLVFPLFFLVFPSLLLVTLGPAVLRMMTVLQPMMEGDFESSTVPAPPAPYQPEP